MKRFKIISLAIILTLGLFGGAYAYWTDQVVVSGTVETGNMRVEWNDFYLRVPGSGSHSAAPLPEYVTAQAYVDSADRQKAIIAIENLYPMPNLPAWHEGKRVAVTGYMQNKGSIPVKFSGAELELLINENDVAEWMRVDIRIAKRISGVWTVIHTKAGAPLKALPAEFENIKGTILNKDDILGFGDETLYIYLDENAPNSVIDSKLEFTLKLNYKQFNDPS